MKILVEVDNNYVLLTDSTKADSFDNYVARDEAINTAMDRLHEYVLESEIKRHNANPVMMKTLGVHPDMRKSA